MVEFHRARRVRRGRFNIFRGYDLRAQRQHGVYAPPAGNGLGYRDNQVGELDQLHQYLPHVVDQRHDLSLREHAAVDLQRAGSDQQHQREVDGDVGQRIHQRADSAGEHLQPRQYGVARIEGGDLVILAPERAQHARAFQIFAGRQRHLVQPGLRVFVHRHRNEHNAEHDDGQHGNRHCKDYRAATVDKEGHDHCTEHDKRRAQEQAQAEIDAGLHLVDVAGHARNQRG